MVLIQGHNSLIYLVNMIYAASDIISGVRQCMAASFPPASISMAAVIIAKKRNINYISTEINIWTRQK